MTRDELIANAVKLTDESPGNYISREAALDPSYVGIRIFGHPVFAIGAADDDIFNKYKSPDVIGDYFIPPAEWLPGAKSVISFFLPYTERIKTSNAADYKWPSNEWLHGRYEGQIFMKELSYHIHSLLIGAGHKSLIPAFDDRLRAGVGESQKRYASSWSERHAAYACGLGTFGLSNGLITEKGVCGRFGSVLTDLDLPKDVRRYDGVYDYCNMCGECVSHCPAGAISINGGQNPFKCSDFLDRTSEKHKPRYGCGKCQVNVPCESAIP